MKLVTFLLSATVLISPLNLAAVQAQSAPFTPNFPALEGVTFSQSQTAQLQEIFLQCRAEMDEIVDPEQKGEFFDALKAGESLREAVKAANLSPEQRAQVRKARKACRKKVVKITTPQQRRQILRNVRSQLQSQRF